jgi:tRNA-specific 2-thiouridylase
MRKKRVALGISGGVDSAVCAQILRDSGYAVTGVYLECYRGMGCRGDEDRQDALSVALHLGLPFQSLDFRAEYRQKVLDYMEKSYQRGETPNPDLLCNREIKFGLFADWARKQNFDLVATGHYARIKNGRLYTARDQVKDQTYFLGLVAGEQWVRVLFPVGNYLKSEVRALARKWDLPVAEKKDSTGVCFVGEVGLRDFLGQKIAQRPGAVIRLEKGKKMVIGEHDGAAFFTLGQRHGFRLKQNQTQMPALYVVGKDLKNNELFVGERAELLSTRLSVICSPALPAALESALSGQSKKLPLLVRIRHQGELIPIQTLKTRGEKIEIELAQKVFAPSPGQFAVFYERDSEDKDNYFCLGAGELGEFENA